MKTAHLLPRLLAVGLLALFVAEASAEMPRHLCRGKTIQNLIDVKSPFFANYLGVDAETGKALLKKSNGHDAADTCWEIVPTTRTRGYRAFEIRNRGDSKYNGWHLDVNVKTGAIQFSKKSSETTSWAIKYVGKHMGYDAFYVQNLASTFRGYDMCYLSIDPETGEIKLSKTPDPGANWLTLPAPDLPGEI